MTHTSGSMIPDALLRVRFLTTRQGGRASAITGAKYGCPILVNGEGFDCRFVIESRTRYDLGETYDIPVKFLEPEFALTRLKEGTVISLWEGKTIGTGQVTKIFGVQHRDAPP